jgi:hypothetical protein
MRTALLSVNRNETLSEIGTSGSHLLKYTGIHNELRNEKRVEEPILKS